MSQYVHSILYNHGMNTQTKDSTMLNIATHNKIFHADEVTAIALLKLFTDEEIVVHRINHQSEDFSAYDMVIDISKKFDGEKYFDHHQNKGGKSSAGLIWDYLGLGLEYPRISKLIHHVDLNDTGIKKAGELEYASLIKAYNTDELSSAAQEEQFDKAVMFALTVLGSMKANQEALIEAQEIVKNSYYFHSNPNIIELEKFTPHWSSFINGFTQPQVKAVVWEDVEEKTWKVKLPPKRAGSFELSTKALLPDETMVFVHTSGHFAVAKDEAHMHAYLAKQIH